MPLNVQIIRCLCFDVDGTLRDTNDQIVALLIRLFKPLLHLSPRLDISTFARRFTMAIENPANLFLHLIDRFGIDGLISRLDFFYDFTHHNKHHPLIFGVTETLTYLNKFYQMVIISTRGSRMTESFLEAYDLRKYFSQVITSQTCRYSKPYPDQIIYAAENFGISPKSCVMIGDTRADIQAGIAAGAQTIAVLSGFGEENELKKSGANLIIPSVVALPFYLNKHNKC